VQKSAEEVDGSAPVHEEVNQKKPIDEEVTMNLSLLVGTNLKSLFC
jgi:hypothetical protein